MFITVSSAATICPDGTGTENEKSPTSREFPPSLGAMDKSS